MEARARLHSITNRILDASPAAYGELFAACDELYRFLIDITATDTDDLLNREPINIQGGKAIGLTWAALCIRDLVRTKKFMQGVYQAVTDRLVEHPGQPVHILYAGTGPFATLVLPLLARFNPEQVQFTLLEINEQSINCLRKLSAILDLQPYIRDIIQADATTWNIPDNDKPGIFISETMNLALTKEPQVSVFMQLVPQLPADTIIIPQKIVLEAAWINPQKRMAYKLQPGAVDDSVQILGTAFELSRGTIDRYNTHIATNDRTAPFEPVQITLPAPGVQGELFILTSIHVYADEQLRLDESALTLPYRLPPVDTQKTAQVSLIYETGINPGIRLYA